MQVNKQEFKMILLRCALTIASSYCIFYAIEFIPIGLHSILYNSGPFFSLGVGYILLDKSVPTIEIVNMIISFIGVLLIICSSEQTEAHQDTETTLNYFFSILLVLMGAIATSFVGVIVKKVKDVHFSVMNTILGIATLEVAVPLWFIFRYPVI